MTDTLTPVWYIAISLHCWGRGYDLAEAKRQLRRAGGTLTRYVAYKLPPEADNPYVDDMGAIRWQIRAGMPRTGTATEVARRGLRRTK